MCNQEEKIVVAALNVFTRYGIGRTTMSDIAKEAGLVRQTLYTVYASKDDVLCAAIRYFAEQSLNTIKGDWESANTLGEKLDIYFEHAVVSSFLIIQSSPDADDMISGYNAAGKAEIANMQVHKVNAIAEILKPYDGAITSAGLGTEKFADFFQNASMNLRNTARDEQHLRSMLKSLKVAVLAVTKSPE